MSKIDGHRAFLKCLQNPAYSLASPLIIFRFLLFPFSFLSPVSAFKALLLEKLGKNAYSMAFFVAFFFFISSLVEGAFFDNFPLPEQNQLEWNKIRGEARELAEGEKWDQLRDLLSPIFSDTDEKPVPAWLLNDLGVAYWELKDKEKAILLWKRAVDLDSKLEEAYINMGLGLAEDGNWEELEILSRQMIREIPGSYAAFSGLGHSYYKRGFYERARAFFERALECAQKRENEAESRYPGFFSQMKKMIKKCRLRVEKSDLEGR